MTINIAEKIVYKHRMDRAPTLDDRTKRVGLEGFLKELQKHGWADESLHAIKKFKWEYRGHVEEGNNYIQWTAISSEN